MRIKVFFIQFYRVCGYLKKVIWAWLKFSNNAPNASLFSFFLGHPITSAQRRLTSYTEILHKDSDYSKWKKGLQTYISWSYRSKYFIEAGDSVWKSGARVCQKRRMRSNQRRRASLYRHAHVTPLGIACGRLKLKIVRGLLYNFRSVLYIAKIDYR